MKLSKEIFSIKNDKQHKVFNLFGIKLKFRYYQNILEDMQLNLFQQSKLLKKLEQKFLVEEQYIQKFSDHLEDIEKFCSSQEQNIQNLSYHLKSIEDFCKTFNNKKAWGLIDSIDGSFRKYFIENNMPEKIKLFKNNLDERSLQVSNITIEKMLRLPDEGVAKFCNLNIDSYKLKFDNALDRQFSALFASNSLDIKNKYKLSKPNYDMEVFLYHHGLKHANQKIKEYVRKKDFIDAGAYIGDSALVLAEYDPSCIHSFEISKQHCLNYIKTMQINNIETNLYKLNNIGLSNVKQFVKLNNNGDMGKKIYNGNGDEVQLIVLDDYTNENNLTVGFIKADIEGAMFEALEGMQETIIKDRPVLSLAIYHSAKEFFDTKILLDEICNNLDYSINIDSHFSESMHIYGTILWAYPKELN